MAKERIVFRFEQPVQTGFISVIEPRAFKDKKNPSKKPVPKYQCEFLLDPDSEKFKELRKLCLQAVELTWPGMNVKEAVAAGKLFMPYKSHEKREQAKKYDAEKAGLVYVEREDSYSKGKIIVSASNKTQPALAYFDGKKLVDLDDPASVQLNKVKFYSGVDALAEINIVAQSGGHDDFVTLYLQQFVALDTGKAIAASRSASATFSGYLGKIQHVDPTLGADDDY